MIYKIIIIINMVVDVLQPGLESEKLAVLNNL
jgi:hypothetical protein